MRAFEFFAGIGGFACACSTRWDTGFLDTVAFDIDQTAGQVYQSNFKGRYVNKEIESLSLSQLATFSAGIWWLSPPCQPYCRRGQHRDLHDPRARSFLRLLQWIEPLRPQVIALENVEGFSTSQAYGCLRDVLDRCHYRITQRVLCPTQLGWPNRRARFYLLASLRPLPDWRPLPQLQRSLASLIEDITLEPDEVEELLMPEDVVEKYRNAMDRVDLNDPMAVTACFGSSYGKSILHAGSYLQTPLGLRRFHPREVACIMGFPQSFHLPDSLTYRQAWKLLGNSLSIPVVEYLLGHIDL